VRTQPLSNPRHPDSPQFWGLLPLGWFRGILRAVPVCHVTIIWGDDVSTGPLIAHSKPLGQLVARVDVKVARGDRGAQVRRKKGPSRCPEMPVATPIWMS
jgi:hypothetical protein